MYSSVGRETERDHIENKNVEIERLMKGVLKSKRERDRDREWERDYIENRDSVFLGHSVWLGHT